LSTTTRVPTALIAVILAVTALTASFLMVQEITEGIPHLEDEAAYIFQARTFARGYLWAPVPPAEAEAAFQVPFVLTLDGRRLAKYNIGWPLLLALGEAVHAGGLVAPVLGAATVGLIVLLGSSLFDRSTGIIAGLLMLSSPFFLIQSSTYMSHAAGAFWAVLLASTMMESGAFHAGGDSLKHGWLVVSGVALGMLFLTRPITALCVAAPVLIIVWGRLPPHRWPRLWPFALAALLVAATQPLYLWAVSGGPFTNLYTLVWPYDRLGFGPGIGPYEGHTLRQGMINASQDLSLWASDQFGWPGLSWVPGLIGLAFGTRWLRTRFRGWRLLLVGPFITLVVVHIAYWVGAYLYGPRYYYEGMAGICVLAAVGLRAAGAWLVAGIARLRQQQFPARWANMMGLGLVVLLIIINLSFYLPGRLVSWHGLYGITAQPLEELEALRAGQRALVLVRGRWVDYAPFSALNSPWYDGEIVALHDLSPTLSQALIKAFPGRQVWYYKDGQFSARAFDYVE